jgi:hypothetical protein
MRRGVKRMKKWFVIIGIIVLLFAGGYFVLSFYAVKFIQTQLQKLVGPGFAISEIKVKSTYLSVKGIRYEDPSVKQKLLQVEEVRIFPDLPSFLKGTSRIKELAMIKPSFFFYRSREGVLVGPWIGMGKGEKEREASKEKSGKEPFHLKIGRIRIKQGSIDFEDRKVGEPPARLRLAELNSEINNINYPIVSARSPIELRARIKGSKKEGDLYARGWINPKTMDMETSFKVQEVDIKTFEPYYRKRVLAEIDSGYINMEAEITLKEKRIDAPGQLELADLHLKEEGTVLWIPAKILVSFLKEKGNRIQIQFHVKGDMGDPQFDLQETFLTRIAVSLAEVLGIPIKGVGEIIFKGTGKGAEGLIKGLKSFEELFKKKKEKE